MQASFAIIYLITVIPSLFISKVWALHTYWLIWVDLTIFVYAVPYYLCNRNLKKIKREKGWVYGSGESISVDTDNIPKFKKLSPVIFIIPCIISLLPLIWDRNFWVLYTVSAVCIVLFMIMYRYFYRNRSERVNDDKELTRMLTQIRNYNWSKIWHISSWMMTILSFAGLLFERYPTIALITVLALSTAVCT